MKFGVYNNDEKIAEVITNHSITFEECCTLAGMNKLESYSLDDPDYELNGHHYWFDDLEMRLEG